MIILPGATLPPPPPINPLQTGAAALAAAARWEAHYRERK